MKAVRSLNQSVELFTLFGWVFSSTEHSRQYGISKRVDSTTASTYEIMVTPIVITNWNEEEMDYWWSGNVVAQILTPTTGSEWALVSDIP
jgi:hypothetical protein